MAEQITFYVTGEGTSSSVSVPFIPGMMTDRDRLIAGGFESDVILVGNLRTGHFVTADMTEITVDSDLFTTDNSLARPRAGKLCQFRGLNYRIISTGEDSTRAYIRLLLGSPNK